MVIFDSYVKLPEGMRDVGWYILWMFTQPGYD